MSDTILHVFWDELKQVLQEGFIMIDDWHFHMQFAIFYKLNKGITDTNVPTTNLVALTFFFNFLRRINIVSFDSFFPGRY